MGIARVLQYDCVRTSLKLHRSAVELHPNFSGIASKCRRVAFNFTGVASKFSGSRGPRFVPSICIGTSEELHLRGRAAALAIQLSSSASRLPFADRPLGWSFLGLDQLS